MNPTVDKSADVDHVVPEQKLRCSNVRFDPGGGGINVSRAIKKMDGRSTAVYLYGGYSGQMLKNLLDKENIEQDPLQIADMTRENLIIYEQATGQQFRFGMPGPDVTDKEWHNCLDVLEKYAETPHYIVLSGSLPPGVPDNFYTRISEISDRTDSRLIIDAGGKALKEALHRKIFLLKVNLRELEKLSGEKFHNERQQENLAVKLVDDGKCGRLVVSLGAGGALAVSEDLQCIRLRTPTVPIKSKVGAGDSMVAGISLGLARAMPFPEAVRYGIAAGAAAVMSDGTQLCRGEDVERLYNDMKKDGSPP
ncbi:MAG: 1-phosphofructokinase family hexose kinase [Desulfobulbaceae bacterium]|nr:1-phosphofructokinase family hexose kinase [Desulfobulbaceae bacterium]